MRIECENTTTLQYLTPCKLERDTAITPLSELGGGFFTDPLSPVLSDTINLIVCVRSCEILNIHWPSIMVTQSRIYRNVLTQESGFDFICDNSVVVIDFFIRIAPVIMGAVVASPEDGINLLSR